MKNKRNVLYSLLIIPFFLGCKGTVNEENKNDVLAASVSMGQKYRIDTKESAVTWKGAMLVGANSHTGYVYLSKGELIMDNGRIVGGTAEVDMTTIEDDAHAKDNGLIDHLRSPDFFDVKRFPVSAFAFTPAIPANDGNKKITGNLTIKGITHPVAFPAKIEVKDGIVRTDGRLVIDRTQWDVRYGSGKFYDLLADQTMSDSIEFHIKIVARK